MRVAARPEEMMGTSLVLNSSFLRSHVSLKILGRSIGSPAPEKITSALASMEVRTISAKVVRATMMFTPMMPCVASRAFSISRRRARRLASRGLLATSGSFIPIMAPAMTPMPPSLATAEASLEREIPTPMPPWTIGVLAMRSPMFRVGKDMKNLLEVSYGVMGTQAGIGMPPCF